MRKCLIESMVLQVNNLQMGNGDSSIFLVFLLNLLYKRTNVGIMFLPNVWLYGQMSGVAAVVSFSSI